MKARSFETELPQDRSLSLNYKAMDSGYWMDFHCHWGFEVLQFFSGNGTLLVEDKIYNLEPGSLYIINSLYLHRTVLDTDSPYIRTVLTVHPDYLIGKVSSMEINDLFSPFYNIKKMGSCKVPVSEEEFKQVEILFSGIRQEMATNKYKSNLMIVLQIAQILTVIGRAYKEGSGNDKKSINGSITDRNINCILEYINTNITNDITMNRLETELNLSRYYLCHIFRKKIGFSIFEYLFHRRVAIAKKMLLENDTSITEIAEILRFSDTAHFSRSFKKVVGLSPKEYRSKERTASLLLNS